MDGLIVYLNGTRGIAVLHELQRRGHKVIRAITLPHLAADGPIAETCRALDISLLSHPNVNDCEALLHLKPRLGIIAGFPTLFRRPLIDLPELGTINLHGGRLPQYRGGSPLNWQIINGETQAWCSIIRVDEGIDTGDILDEAAVPLLPDDTVADLHARTHSLFATLAADVVERLERGNTTGRPQDEAQACYWHQRNDADGRICWSAQTAIEVHNLVRAVTHPYPGAHSVFQGRKIRVIATLLIPETIRGVPGRVVYVLGRGPYVVCRDRALLIAKCTEDGSPEPIRLPSGSRLE